MDLVKLGEDSHDLLEQLADRFPQQALETCRSFDNAGEWGQLIELISATLVKRSVPVTSQERDALADLLYRYSIPYKHHEYISNRDETIASLKIADGE